MRLACVLLALVSAACGGVEIAMKNPFPSGIPSLPEDPMASVPSPLADAPRVGSAACQPCHAAQHAQWAASSHATSVRKADIDDEDRLSSFMACSDMTVTHVLGDRHQVRFLQERPDVPWGEGRFLALPCSWDVHAKSLEMLHESDWRTLPWESSCAACHVTNQAKDMSFQELGIGCERCHGPGGAHVAAPSRSNILTFRGTARDEVTVCASCHLQDGHSRRTGRKFPDGYLPGGTLLDDFDFDWSVLDNPDPAQAIDVHQKLLIRNVLRDGDASLRCTSCHSLHDLSHEKHHQVPKQPLCDSCHLPDMKLREYRQSCNTCEF
jgi:hypothetical protein